MCFQYFSIVCFSKPSCGRTTIPVGSDGEPSPTALIADTRN